MKRNVAFAVLLVGALVGCGGGAEVVQHNTTVSQGQQLEDLKRALDQGAINQDEYQKLQNAILKKG